MIKQHPDNPPPTLPTTQEFAGKVAVVTGGSDGIGKGIVAALVEVGAETFFCGRRVELGEATQKQLGPKAHFVKTDLRDPDQIKALIDTAGSQTGSIDYLVNNAGTDPAIAFPDTTIDDFNKVIETDLRAYYLVAQAALPYLEKGQGKAIVNIGTTNYEKGIPGMTAYSCAKAGIMGFTRALARELGITSKIRVNLVSPGWIITERQVAERGLSEHALQSLIHSQCMQQPMYPEHLAPVVVFMLSKAASGVAGQNLIVDGGQVLG